MIKAVNWLAGVDEAGRGPLAGPVVAAAVILNQSIDGLNDSKKLTALKRTRLSCQIKNQSVAWSIGYASVEEIDRINILHASMLAMRRAVLGLPRCPRIALIDGNRIPLIPCDAEAIVKGDAKVASISAASILAKVERDQLMLRLHTRFPQFGFAKHKGYPTRQHLEALQHYGVTTLHRKSFAPVKALLSSGKNVQ